MWSNMWSGGFFDHLGLRGKCLYRRRIKGLRGMVFSNLEGERPAPKLARYGDVLLPPENASQFLLYRNLLQSQEWEGLPA